MFCNKCGVEIPDGSSFCNKCGQSQGGDAPAAPGAPATAPTSPGAGSGRPLSEEALREPTKEEAVWAGRYSGRAMGLAFVGAGIWFAGLWIAYFVMSAEGKWFHDRSWFLYMIAVLSPLPALYAGWVTLWRKLTLRYRLTSQRLFLERGFFSRSVDEIELFRIEDVSTTQNIMERIFDVGTVLVLSKDDTHPRLPLTGIHQPLALKEKIRGLTKSVRKRNMNFEIL